MIEGVSFFDSLSRYLQFATSLKTAWLLISKVS
jgi:hypothetical protein